MAFTLDSTLTDIIELDLLTGRVVPFLAGQPAIGKTSFIEALEEKDNYKVFSISINTLADRGDLTGNRTLQDPADGKWKQMFFPHETIVRANDFAQANPEITVILNCDEINRTDTDITSAVMTLFTSRSAGTTKLAPNLRFVATGNTSGNVNTLDSASLTRFAIYEVAPDAQQFMKVMGNRLNNWVKIVLMNRPELIFCTPTKAVATTDNDEDGGDNQMAMFEDFMADSQDMSQFTAPRTIEGVSDWLNNASHDLLMSLMGTMVASDEGRDLSQLMITLQAHTGDTDFTTELAAVIAKDLTSQTQNTSSGNQNSGPTKPAFFDTLVSLKDRTQVENMFSRLSVSEQVAAFGYALTRANTANDTPAEVINMIIRHGDIAQGIVKDADQLGKYKQALFMSGINGYITPVAAELLQNIDPASPLYGDTNGLMSYI